MGTSQMTRIFGWLRLAFPQLVQLMRGVVGETGEESQSRASPMYSPYTVEKFSLCLCFCEELFSSVRSSEDVETPSHLSLCIYKMYTRGKAARHTRHTPKRRQCLSAGTSAAGRRRWQKLTCHDIPSSLLYKNDNNYCNDNTTWKIKKVFTKCCCA